RAGSRRELIAVAIRSAHLPESTARSRRVAMPAERQAAQDTVHEDTAHDAPTVGSDLPIFRAPYAPPDEALAARFLGEVGRPAAAEARIDARATRLIGAIRARAGGVGGIEDFLHEYSLSTKEGLALMVLAEALLRVPDNATADRLIEDKLSAGDFTHH